MLSMLQKIEKLAAEGRLREDNMQEIISGFKEAMQEGIEKEERVFMELHGIRVLLGERMGGEVEDGEEEDFQEKKEGKKEVDREKKKGEEAGAEQVE
ncbi:hypothetical protein AOL_s00006g496 [Orbilia oligospora ATCC 24927]|uniref:Uncharacterized protein n=1 Tax=Arthrobotrys oligospora (strain ATCC 24927 / CBS 115.81 / DSM 1491) TaxID=756982 RepID=G1X0U5_ARTOA|nr:hypothetical protein AOL_s00006g496 [Orbilia oligospora ATCC 24927]EGX53235.1 hypothetical protein AOL_s00006g496 [Orbilia oligospora ATCC 24927]